MQKFIFSVSLLFIITFCTAQNISYQVLDPGNNTFSDEILPIQNGFLSFNISANKKVQIVPLGMGNLRMGVEIVKMDKDMKTISSSKLFNGDKKLLPGLFRIFKFGNNNCIVYQDSEDKKVRNIKMMTIDEGTLQVKSDRDIIDLEKNNISYDFKKLMNTDLVSFRVMVSPSHKRLLVYSEPVVAKDENKFIYVVVMDENLKVIKEKKVDIKLIPDNYRKHDMTIDDPGNIYLAYKEYEDGDRKGWVKVDGKRIASYKNRLLIVKADGREVVTDIVKLEGYSTKDLGLVYSPKQNKLFMLGSYSIGWDDEHIGFFKSEIDVATMKVGPTVTTEFPDDILAQLDKDGYAHKDGKNKGLKSFFTSSPVLRGDGSVDLMLRYSWKKEVTGDGKYRVTYYEGSFLDIHFIDGKIYYTRIPRDISSPSTNFYTGYYPYSPDERLFLFYNESEKNIERDIADKPKDAIVQNTEICVVTISKKGDVKREIALKGYESKSIGVMSSSFSIYPNMVFLFLQRLSFMSMSTRDTKFARVIIK